MVQCIKAIVSEGFNHVPDINKMDWNTKKINFVFILSTQTLCLFCNFLNNSKVLIQQKDIRTLHLLIFNRIVKGGRICHPKICHFGIRSSLS